MKKYNTLLAVPYFLWLLFFVLAPVVLVVGYSFFDQSGHFTLANYAEYFGSGKYLLMTFNSITVCSFDHLDHTFAQLSDSVFFDKIKA